MSLYKNIISAFALVLLNYFAYSQKVYFTNDIFQPILTNNTLHSIHLNYSFVPDEIFALSNIKFASNPYKNFAYKISLRKNLVSKSKSLNNLFNFNLGAGLFKKFTTKKANYRYKWNIENSKKVNNPFKEQKIIWKNNFRKTKAKKRIKFKKQFLRPSSFIFDAYLSYGFATVKGFDYINNGTSELLANYNLNLENFNLDLGVHYLTFGRFSFSNIIQFSLINIKKFTAPINFVNLYFFTEDVNSVEPFLATSYNFKTTFTTKNIDYYFKINNTLGKRNFTVVRKNYSGIIYKWMFVFGLNLNTVKPNKKRKRN